MKFNNNIHIYNLFLHTCYVRLHVYGFSSRNKLIRILVFVYCEHFFPVPFFPIYFTVGEITRLSWVNTPLLCEHFLWSQVLHFYTQKTLW